MGIIKAAVDIYRGTQQRKKQVAALKARKKYKMQALKQASQITGEEQAALSRMQRGAEEGTMDVDALNQQMAQPLYQQGEAQEAMQQAQITQQGLEGSIIAQDVSRKVGADVRASIAEQARGIAFANEKTKADAERRLQDAKMKRGQLLRDIAMKRGQVMAEYKAGRDAQPSDLDLIGGATADLLEEGEEDWLNMLGLGGGNAPGEVGSIRTGAGTNAQSQLGF